jgi:hypothetical protein
VWKLVFEARFKPMFAQVDFAWKVMNTYFKWHFYKKVTPVNDQLNFHGGFHGPVSEGGAGGFHTQFSGLRKFQRRRGSFRLSSIDWLPQ